MAHTTKMRVKHYQTLDSDVQIFTNGGDFYSVFWMAIDARGAITDEGWRSFRGIGSKERACAFALAKTIEGAR